jgi:Asparaginase
MFSPLLHLLGLARRKSAGPPRRHRWCHRAVPRLEALENRLAPATFVVNTLADTPDANVGDGFARDTNGNTSLRAAIMEGNAAGNTAITINFRLSGSINLDSALPDLNNNFTIVGPGSANMTVNRNTNAPQFGIFRIPAGKTCSIQGLKITGGDSGLDGGGIWNRGNLTLIGCDIAYNSASGGNGGGVYNADSGTLTASACSVHDNQAIQNGGGFYEEGSNASLNIVSGCSIIGNNANNGGGIYIRIGTCTVRNSSIYYNYASAFGGGIYIAGSTQNTFSMNGGTLDGNYAYFNGGGIFAAGGDSSFTGVLISQNSAAYKGGGFYVEGGAIHFYSCTITGNSATVLGPGGAFKAPGSYSADANCTIDDAIDPDV